MSRPATAVREADATVKAVTAAGNDRLRKLRLNSVSRHFGGVVALDKMDLTIAGGEFIALLGPSGCGKSTALGCLAGLQPLTEGEIWADNVRVDTLAPERREFGMVFQNYALFPHLSVRRNIGFGLEIRRTPKAEAKRRIDEALELVDLSAHADKLPGQLSGGQQQRVAIARAVVIQPRLVLMDEPLSNLDAKLRMQMRTEIRRLHQSLGLTTIYVTHDQEEALALADRLVVLRAGRIEQVGSPEDVYGFPVNTYVASFMGYRNLLRVDIDPSGTTADQAEVRAPGFHLTGTPRSALPGSTGVVGIRPEDFHLGPVAGNSIKAKATVVEFTGHSFAVEAITEAGDVLHMRIRERVTAGETIEVGVSPERALVFAADDVSDETAGEPK